MRHPIQLIAAATVLAAVTVSGVAAQRGWTLISETRVGKDGDRDTVYIQNQQRFAAVRLCVFGRPVRLNSFIVRFGNGREQALDVRSEFRPGSCTRSIDLRGERHRVEWVKLDYRRLPGNGAPVVRIQAR